MPRIFVFLIIGLFFGTGFGFLLAASTGSELKGHDHGTSVAHDHSAHDHSAAAHARITEVTGPAPTVALTLHPESAQSRNIEIATTNFTFAPEQVNGTHAEGYGHAHIYINGVKLARVYGSWVHLEALPVGTHEIKVTLNANDHAQLAVNGQPVEDVKTLVIE